MTSRTGRTATRRLRSRPTHTASRARGFTLVEILLVLVILTTLLLAMAPRFASVRGRLLAEDGARMLAADLRRTRLDAIQARGTAAVVFTRPERGEYEIHRVVRRQTRPWDFGAADGEATDARLGAADPRTRALPSGPHLDADPQELLFYPDGTTSGGRITVGDPDGRVRYTVTLEPTSGRVAVTFAGEGEP